MAKYQWAIVDYIPVIGHIKGFIHKLYGNKVAAIHASFAATRTTTILAAGAGGFFVGGPPAAIICLGIKMCIVFSLTQIVRFC